MRILKFMNNYILNKVIDNMFMKLIIFMNQNHTNHPFECGNIKQEISTVVGGFRRGVDTRDFLRASKDSWDNSSHMNGVSFFKRCMKPLLILA
jgi:hypothetical protein